MLEKKDMLRVSTSLLISLLCQVGYAQNVGINSTGAAPDASAMLDVVSTTKGFLAPRMTLAQRGQISNPATGLLIYQTNSVSGFYYYTGSAWTLLSSSSFSGWGITGNSSTTAGTNFLGTTDAVDLVIKTNNTERARFLSSGYAGTGTTTPAAPWHVSSTSGTILFLQSTTGGSGTQASIAFKTYGGTTYPTGLLSAVDDNYSSYFAFFTKIPGGDTNPLVERMRITTTGEVGIGTTTITSGYKLEVAGYIKATGLNNASDRRLKTDIKSLNYGVKELMALEPVTYHWIDTTLSSQRQIGLIAQDTRKVIPEVVSGDEEKEKLGINYIELIPVLVNAIKEQQKEIEGLKKSEEINRNLIKELLKKTAPF